MQDIQDMVMKNYQDNMEYFKENHIILYSKLVALEEILDDGRYPQKYELEYKDGYFDIIELASGSFLYGENSQNVSKELTNQINMQKDQQVFKSSYNYIFTPEAMTKIKDADALTMHSTTAPIIDYNNSNTKPSMNLTRVHKFIFIGIGLGLHVSNIIKKIGADSILFVEDDIELFRLSLFTINYKEVLKGKHSFFSIAQTNEEFSSLFDEFYLDIFIQNLYLKFSLFSNTYEHKIKEIQTFIVSRPETAYPHEYLLYKNSKVLQKLTNNYKFLDISKKDNESFFTDKPMIVIGAGPSLHKNIDWLQKNQDKFIIVCVFAALKTLYKNSISPDIIVQLDEKVTQTVNLINSFENLEFLKDSLFVFSASVPDILFETFNKENIYLLEDRTHYKLNDSVRAYSVGEIAYALSLSFNPNEIYLLGLDLALSEDGETHAKDHHLGNKLDTSNVDAVHQSVSIMSTVIQIKGNFKDKVISTPVFSLSVKLVNYYTNLLKSSNQKIYNLNDGAYFNQTTPLEISKYIGSEKIDKQNLKTKLSTLFDSYSDFKLSEEEIALLKVKAKQVKEFYKILDDFSKSPSSNKDSFMQLYRDLVASIVNNPDSELVEIMRIYLFKTSTYVSDLFTTKELENPKKHIKKMKKIVITQMKKIIDFYEKGLLEVVEK